jgi:ribosomal protein L17
MLNQISAVLSDADKAEIKASIAALESKMPFLKPITAEQTKARQNLGDSKDHVLKGINAMKLRPDIMSGTFLVAEYFKDLVFHDQLYELQQELAALQEKLNGTMTWLGQDMMANTREVYEALQREVKNDPSLQPLLDEMAPYYAKSRKTDTTPPASAK